MKADNMKKLLFLFLLNSQTVFAGGYIGVSNMNDEPQSRGFLYWSLLLWFCFWGWLSSKYSNKNKNISGLCGYICLGVPLVIYIFLFIRAVITQKF